MSSRLIKRQIPILLVFVIGFLITIDWFVVWEPLQIVTKNLMNFQVIMFAAMMYFSMINLWSVHSQRIRRNLREKKYYDVIILGTGPAGLQAAIHAARKKVSVLVLGKETKSSL